MKLFLKFYEPALYFAVEKKDIEIIKLLLSHPNINVNDIILHNSF